MWAPFSWSLSPNMDLRILAVNRGENLVFVYVDHHDAAYEWANHTTTLWSTTHMLSLSISPALDSLESRISGLPLPIPIKDLLLQVKDTDLFLEAISSVSPEWQEWLLEADPSIHASPPIGSSLRLFPAQR